VGPNRDIGRRVREKGVVVVESRDELELYCGQAENVLRGYAGRGITIFLDAVTRQLVGMVITDHKSWAFKEFPVLRVIWEQYKRAKRFRRRQMQAEAAMRLFHATACVALPELAPTILAYYPEPEPVPVPLQRFFGSLDSLLRNAFVVRMPALAEARGAADEPIELQLIDAPQGVKIALIPNDGTLSIRIDWPAFRFDVARPAQVGIWVEEPAPPELPWNDWLFEGGRVETIAPGELDVRFPLTSRGHAIPGKELEPLREWMATGLRLVGPWQQE